jgi:hypothetical protein
MIISANVSGTARMRLHRMRRQRGRRCVTLEIRETELAALVRRRLLDPDSQNDNKAIRNALYLLLDRQLGGAA